MRRTQLTLIVLLLLLPVFAFADLPSPVTLNASIDASIAQQICPEGQPAILTLALHNSGAQSLSIGGSAFEESSFKITVTDGEGRVMPRTAFGNRVLTRPWAVAANAMVVLDPGQTLRYGFNLARLFDLSRAGNYTVSVSRSLRPWVLPTPPGGETPQEITLTAGPLKIQRVEDAAATSGPTALTPPLDHHTFLYLANTGYATVRRFRIEENGRLSSALEMPPLAGNGASSVTATPDGRFLYVNSSSDKPDSQNTVSQFRIGNDGELSPLSPPTVPTQKIAGLNVPGFLLIDPKGHFLYALSNWGNTLYAIDPEGKLTATDMVPQEAWVKNQEHNVIPTLFGTIDPTGTFLYACNGATAGYQISPDGRGTALSTPWVRASPPLGGEDRAIAFTPSNNFAFVLTSKTRSRDGSKSDDLVVPMRVAADGTLSPLPGAQMPNESGPFWPGYEPFAGTTFGVDPSGRFLLVAEPEFIARYRIGSDGSLAPLGVTPEMGKPASLLFGRSGIVYAANLSPLSIRTFRLNDQGDLTQVGGDMPYPGYFGGFALANVPALQNWGQAMEGLEVSARLSGEALSRNALSGNSPMALTVVLTVVLKNTTFHSLRLGTVGADTAAFHLSLMEPQRQSPYIPQGQDEPVAVPLLAAGYDLLDTPGSSTTPLVLTPGSQRQYRFVLSRLADLTLAGNYTVRITRILPDKTAATSPPLPFRLDGTYDGITRNGQEQDVF